MSKYEPWRAFFESASGDSFALDFTELEELINGSLPASARRHSAWWSGDRNHAVWQESGWVASPDLENEKVIFKKGPGLWPQRSHHEPPAQTPVRPEDGAPRLVLIGCVKSKVGHPAPAKDLYDSTLWRKRRRYAEATRMPWAILSAEHGMVAPDTVLEPYDRYLGSEPASYRKEWAAQTAKQVIRTLSEKDLRAVEIHAGAAYVNSGLRARLQSSGIAVSWPVEGMSFGVQLGWYS